MLHAVPLRLIIKIILSNYMKCILVSILTYNSSKSWSFRLQNGDGNITRLGKILLIVYINMQKYR
jgi:hypothetical protein